MKRISRAVKIFVNTAVIAALMCGLTGCTNDLDNQENESASITQSMVEEHTSAVSETLPQEEEYTPEFGITNWTMKDLVTDIEVEGDKFSLPCNIADIGKEYSVDFQSYHDNDQTTAGTLYKKDKTIGLVYFNGNVEEDILNTDIKFFFMGGGYELPQFNVMGITNESTREEVVNILGDPNMHPDESDRLFAYGFNKNEYIIINFSEEDPDKIGLFFIIYNV